MLIAFEGIDQSGKATQARGAVEALRARGRQTALISFPRYETAIGRLIRQALVGERRYDAATVQLLCAANRFETASEIADRIEGGGIAPPGAPVPHLRRPRQPPRVSSPAVPPSG